MIYCIFRSNDVYQSDGGPCSNLTVTHYASYAFLPLCLLHWIDTLRGIYLSPENFCTCCCTQPQHRCLACHSLTRNLLPSLCNRRTRDNKKAPMSKNRARIPARAETPPRGNCSSPKASSWRPLPPLHRSPSTLSSGDIAGG